MPEMLGEMVESCAPSGCRACSVCSPCTCQMLGRIVLPSTLALPFHIALVFLRVSAALLQGAYSHTEKHMRGRGQRMRQKIASRGIISFCTPPSGGRPMLPGNTQDSMVRAGFSSKRKAKERV